MSHATPLPEAADQAATMQRVSLLPGTAFPCSAIDSLRNVNRGAPDKLDNWRAFPGNTLRRGAPMLDFGFLKRVNLISAFAHAGALVATPSKPTGR
jgi:hypothetical protein